MAVPVPEESVSKPNSPKASKQASTPKASRNEAKPAAKPDVKKDKDKVREWVCCHSLHTSNFGFTVLWFRCQPFTKANLMWRRTRWENELAAIIYTLAILVSQFCGLCVNPCIRQGLLPNQMQRRTRWENKLAAIVYTLALLVSVSVLWFLC